MICRRCLPRYRGRERRDDGVPEPMDPIYPSRQAMLRALEDDFLRGQNCAESIFTKLGQYYDPAFDPHLMRLATGFGGGIGRSADVCGVLTGGVLLIGYLAGRSSVAQSRDECYRLARTFRDRFLQEYGGTTCYHFTKGEFTPENHRRCATLLTTAARILLDLLPPPGTAKPALRA
jgi:C_GCAxxG_C_C family probable redox protein